MPNFDDKYEIRQANINDIPLIMNYIEEDWRSGHIMARNRDFFEYEFLESDNSVNVVVAIDKETGRIDGMIGYLYSSNTPGKKDVWGSIWKVRDGSVSLLGAEIMRRMEIISGCRYNLGTGANPKTNIPIMRVMFRRTADKMKQYYRLSPRAIDDYKIAKISYEPDIVAGGQSESDSNYSVERIIDADILKTFFESSVCQTAIPYKDLWYVKKKFFDHPINDYEVYGIRNTNDYEAIFVLRRQMANERMCIRMVEYIGDMSAIKHTNSYWDKLFADNEDMEYVDFYCLGMNDADMSMAGFSVRKDEDDNIIPNYFNPFCRENIDIWVHYPVPGVIFTKADGDQDRPS